MGALTQPRQTPQRQDGQYLNTDSLGAASGAVLYVGALVMGKTVGTGNSLRMVRAQQGTGLRVLGVVDNQPNQLPQAFYTSTQDGVPVLQFKRGTFKFNIDPADPVTPADLYNMVYALDDQTIRRDPSGGYSMAGRLVGIDDSSDPTGPGAWVEIGAFQTSAPAPTGLFLP